MKNACCASAKYHLLIIDELPDTHRPELVSEVHQLALRLGLDLVTSNL